MHSTRSSVNSVLGTTSSDDTSVEDGASLGRRTRKITLQDFYDDVNWDEVDCTGVGAEPLSGSELQISCGSSSPVPSPSDPREFGWVGELPEVKQLQSLRAGSEGRHSKQPLLEPLQQPRQTSEVLSQEARRRPSAQLPERRHLVDPGGPQQPVQRPQHATLESVAQDVGNQNSFVRWARHSQAAQADIPRDLLFRDSLVRQPASSDVSTQVERSPSQSTLEEGAQRQSSTIEAADASRLEYSDRSRQAVQVMTSHDIRTIDLDSAATSRSASALQAVSAFLQEQQRRSVVELQPAPREEEEDEEEDQDLAWAGSQRRGRSVPVISMRDALGDASEEPLTARMQEQGMRRSASVQAVPKGAAPKLVEVVGEPRCAQPSLPSLARRATLGRTGAIDWQACGPLTAEQACKLPVTPRPSMAFEQAAVANESFVTAAERDRDQRDVFDTTIASEDASTSSNLLRSGKESASLYNSPASLSIDARSMPVDADGGGIAPHLSSSMGSSNVNACASRSASQIEFQQLLKPVEAWDEEDVATWISHISPVPLDLIQLLRAQAINGAVLLTLSEKDLCGLPAKFGHRRLLMLASQELRRHMDRNGLAVPLLDVPEDSAAQFGAHAASATSAAGLVGISVLGSTSPPHCVQQVETAEGQAQMSRSLSVQNFRGDAVPMSPGLSMRSLSKPELAKVPMSPSSAPRTIPVPSANPPMSPTSTTRTIQVPAPSTAGAASKVYRSMSSAITMGACPTSGVFPGPGPAGVYVTPTLQPSLVPTVFARQHMVTTTVTAPTLAMGGSVVAPRHFMTADTKRVAAVPPNFCASGTQAGAPSGAQAGKAPAAPAQQGAAPASAGGGGFSARSCSPLGSGRDNSTLRRERTDTFKPVPQHSLTGAQQGQLA